MNLLELAVFVEKAMNVCSQKDVNPKTIFVSVHDSITARPLEVNSTTLDTDKSAFRIWLTPPTPIT